MAVLAASLIGAGSHHVDVIYRRDLKGPEENIETADFADAADADGIRWTLQIDGATAAHGKYPWKLHGDLSSIAGTEGELRAEEEAAVMAEVPGGVSAMQAAAESADRVMLWMRIQNGPGWHGDAPLPSGQVSAKLDPKIMSGAEEAGEVMSILEGEVEHQLRQALTTPDVVAVAGNLGLKQAAPLLEMLWSDPANKGNGLLRNQVVIAAARMGQPMDILQEAAHDMALDPTVSLAAAGGLARAGIQEGQKIIVDRMKQDAAKFSSDLEFDTPIIEEYATLEIRDAAHGLLEQPHSTGGNVISDLLEAVDAKHNPIDQVIGLAAARANGGLKQEQILFDALSERASLDDVPTIEQIPAMDGGGGRSAQQNAVLKVRIVAVARIHQRFWREADRAPAAARALADLPAPPPAARFAPGARGQRGRGETGRQGDISLP